METPTTNLPKIAPIKFIRESIGELKKVSWPTRDETVKLTLVVIAISVLVGIFIGGTDMIFLRIQSFLFQR